MLKNKKIIVVMPAYNAEKTLMRTYSEIPHDIVDKVVLVDDKSSDRTIEVAQKLNLKVFAHDKNKGYGGNQKTCYKEALTMGGNIIIMLHPDYQYDPRLITAMASLIAEDVYDVVIASRIIGSTALKGGMPLYKYISNRFLTMLENLIIGEKVSEYHTGYRAFSDTVLKKLPLENNSDDFVFDNQMLLQCFYYDFKVGEISCPTKYEADSSSINFRRSLKYGLEVIKTAVQYKLAKIKNIKIFPN
jgi:glycosyltransferase involved in cell wall biosynthesis